MKYIKDIETRVVAYADEKYSRHSEASMAECPDGSLRIVWQRFVNGAQGSFDASPAAIVMADCPSGDPIKDGFTNVREVAECIPECVNVYSPHLIRLQDGGLMLLYKRYMQLEQGKPLRANGYYKITYDEGATFGEEHTLWEQKPIGYSNDSSRRLKSGRLIVPITVSSGGIWTPTDHSAVSTMYSDDDGRTWQYSDHIVDLPMRGAMEPFIAECSDGRLIMVMRNQLGSLMKCYSSDEGVTWSKPQTTGLPIPESCPYICNIPGSDTLMVIWNNSEYDPKYASHFGRRNPLTVAFSDDDGKTFYGFTDIEDDPDRGFTNPGVRFTSDGRCLVTYHTMKYDAAGYMGGPIDLRIASFRIEDKES